MFPHGPACFLRRLCAGALWLLLPGTPGFALESGALPRFVVSDLGTLGGPSSQANRMNDGGAVVGFSETASGTNNAFFWTGVMQDLGAQGGSAAQARSVNRHGEVCGDFISNGFFHGFAFSGGIMSNVPPPPPGNQLAIRGINDGKVLVGRYFLPMEGHAFVQTESAFIDLGTHSGINSSDAYDVNDRTQVVGETDSLIGLPATLAFLWEDLNGNASNDPGEMLAFRPLLGRNAAARAINESGVICGAAEPTGQFVPRHGFIWRAGNGVDIGTLKNDDSSEATDINNADVAVGFSTVAGEEQEAEAVIYVNGIFTNLNALIPGDAGWTLRVARTINDYGQIAGWGVVSGATHAFLLTPTSGPELCIVRGEVTPFDDAADVSVAWQVFATGMVFTVEGTDNILTQSWQALEPAAQWPITSAYHLASGLTNLPFQFLRVRTGP